MRVRAQNKKGFSVVFPGRPGLISAGDGYEGLASHIGFLTEEGEAIPEPRTIGQAVAFSVSLFSRLKRWHSTIAS